MDKGTRPMLISLLAIVPVVYEEGSPREVSLTVSLATTKPP